MDCVCRYGRGEAQLMKVLWTVLWEGSGEAQLIKVLWTVLLGKCVVKLG